MWKNERQGVLSHPLVFTVGHESINGDLSSVKEVTKLCFPNGHVVRVVQWVTVLVWKDSILWKRRVVDFDFATTWLKFGEFLKRIKSLFCLLIRQIDVSLRKSTSLHILTSQSDIITFIVQTEQSQRFARCPVQIVRFKRLYSFINVILLDSWMNCEIGWYSNWCESELFQELCVETCLKLLAV